MERKRPSKGQSAHHFASGLGSGILSAVLLQPLDVLKTRVQQSASSSLSANLRELSLSPHVVLSLWRGTVPSALRTGFGSALYFTALNTIRQQFDGRRALGSQVLQENVSSALPASTNLVNLMSGAAARTIAGFVLMPLTIIKVRFESSLYSYTSIAAAAADIQHKDGLRGFFSGFGVTALRDAPYAGTYVLIYELLKKHIGSTVAQMDSRNGAPQRVTFSTAGSVNFVAAILAGASCSILSNPFDAMKTRIQLQPRHYRNIWHAGYTMILQDGVRSLWSGLALRMSRKALSSAIAWTIYEELLRRLDGR